MIPRLPFLGRMQPLLCFVYPLRCIIKEIYGQILGFSIHQDVFGRCRQLFGYNSFQYDLKFVFRKSSEFHLSIAINILIGVSVTSGGFPGRLMKFSFPIHSYFFLATYFATEISYFPFFHLPSAMLIVIIYLLLNKLPILSLHFSLTAFVSHGTLYLTLGLAGMHFQQLLYGR